MKTIQTGPVWAKETQDGCFAEGKQYEVVKRLEPHIGSGQNGIVVTTDYGEGLFIPDEEAVMFFSDCHPFEAAARPLIKYLSENHHPHVTAIVTQTGAEMLEGIKSTGKIEDYIVD